MDQPNLANLDLLAEGSVSIGSARTEFGSEIDYLDTATLGVPPRRSLEALHEALDSWRLGLSEPADSDGPLATARAAYARLVSVEVPWVAVGSQVSVFAGLVAASLPEGAQVLTAEGDFTSILFPFYAQRGRGVTVREVPLDHLAEAVTAETTLVSVSAVQSADGKVADLDALHTACEATGTQVLLDTTQAIGWLPIDASRFAYTVCAGYKWLLSPRGTAYFTIQPRYWDELVPHTAGWFAGEDPWSSLYGPPLRLARDARRFDVSPAWHAWIAAGPALELLAAIGTSSLHRHSVGLANRFCTQVGLRPQRSGIVALAASEDAVKALRAERIRASTRNGRVRLAFHLFNDQQDVDHASDVLHRYCRQ